MLTRYSLRLSLPLLLGLFALTFTLLLTAWHLPGRVEETLQHWRVHTRQHLALLQSSLSDHQRMGRTAELQTELADVASLQGVRWAMVIDQQLRVIGSTRLGLDPTKLTMIDPDALAEYVRSGRVGWLGDSSARQLVIYPLDRTTQTGAPLREALLVEFDFAPVVAQTRRDGWFYLAQTLSLLVLLGLALNLLYNHLITRRLARIDRAARTFAQDQQPQPPAVSGQDEIGQLATTFSQMMNQLHQRRLAQQESEQLMRNLIDTAPIGMLVVDGELRVQQANPAAAALFDCAPDELVGNVPADRLIEPDATERLQRAPANSVLQLTGHRHGQQVPLEITCTPFLRNGETHALVLLRDIGDRLRAEQRLRFLAHFDPLTQLANRNFLVQRLEQLLSERVALSLLYLDLDHFKRINDALSHEIGDRLLVQVGERLRQLAPEPALLARTGGDEFMLLLERSDAQQAGQLAEHLIEGFQPPMRINQYECFVSPSIGIASSDGRGSASELLKQVDLALYAAKDAGRNCTRFFSQELSAAAERRRQLEQALRRALDEEQFVLHYQAQVNAAGEPEVMEALLRWNSPERGLVPPGEFIPVLEDSGLIIETTRWVFRQACRQARQWREQGHQLRIAVNLSPLDFRQADLAGSLLAILAEEDTPAELLELEITETILLREAGEAMDRLKALAALGVWLAIDDFGTGYSCLAYLKQLPIRKLKIDRSFVRGLPDDEDDRAIVSAIVQMARALRLTTIAEGVETEAQRQLLGQLQCEQYQGYLCAPGLPPDALQPYLLRARKPTL